MSCPRFNNRYCWHDNDPEWKSIRMGRKEQRLLAQQLHQKADVQEGLCGIPEVKKFQKVIDKYQIIVLSAKHFNAIVYKGSGREKQIYLYHYDVITSLILKKIVAVMSTF